MQKIELEIAGLAPGHSSKNNSYTLILTEKNGTRKLPVVIGAFEAQAIALVLEEIKPQRPLTHDLIKNLAETFHIDVLEVYISALVEGVFYSRIKCLMNDFQAEVDARTSDAIALAVRFHCPIYVSETIMNQAGITESDEVEQEPERPVSEEELFIEIGKAHDFSNLAKTELEKLLEEAIRLEDYAKAAQIRDEINSRL